MARPLRQLATHLSTGRLIAVEPGAKSFHRRLLGTWVQPVDKLWIVAPRKVGLLNFGHRNYLFFPTELRYED